MGSADVLDGIRFDRDPDTLAMNCQAPAMAFGFSCRSTVTLAEVHLVDTDAWVDVRYSASTRWEKDAALAYEYTASNHIFVSESSTTGVKPSEIW